MMLGAMIAVINVDRSKADGKHAMNTKQPRTNAASVVVVITGSKTHSQKTSMTGTMGNSMQRKSWLALM